MAAAGATASDHNGRRTECSLSGSTSRRACPGRPTGSHDHVDLCGLGRPGASLTHDLCRLSPACSLVTRYVSGAVATELAERDSQRGTGLTEYPQFRRRVVDAVDRPPEEQFEFGLECGLDGIAVRVGVR
jgi:hypothetical protein